ncbi:MAG: hypothetical protein E7812_03665 [Phenylobacterium sp.]|nr:MAG: hypothetical protein E7812_03665 [Phenylobacterium sp.]
MRLTLPRLATLAAGLAFATAAAAHPPIGQTASTPPATPAATAPTTASLQGDQASWINDPHMHAFYDATVAAFANGPAKVDQAAFEKKAHDIFWEFAISRGASPQAMEEHLKLIPDQVVQIAKEDPKVLASYHNFVEAVFGPQ